MRPTPTRERRSPRWRTPASGQRTPTPTASARCSRSRRGSPAWTSRRGTACHWGNAVDLGLEGKVVLVTGAASGIGRATANAFAREGATLALHDRNAEGLEAAREETGGSVHLVDVADSAAVDAAHDAVAAEHGRI